MTEVKAKLKYLRTSPRKTRLVVDLIKGVSVGEAEKQLSFSPKRVANPLLKLLRSAIANAKNNFQLEEKNLYIKKMKVDEGPTLKRYLPRARGRATMLRKRTSHITLILDTQNQKSEARNPKF